MIHRAWTVHGTVFAAAGFLAVSSTSAAPVAGGTLDPTTIPKYVTPLVIPPVMNNDGTANSYDIAVREFKQQVLPGGIWNTLNGRKDKFKPTRIWSYGPADDPLPTKGVAPAANSQFNYPAYTIEAEADQTVNVRWINDLVDDEGNFLNHLLPIDQTAHWANPQMDCRTGEPRTDCAGNSQEPYYGPVPIVTHVHGAHVGPESDGYPEAWWLPAANDTPEGWATSGTLFDDVTGTNDGSLGYVDFSYPNTQPAATLWYHDHTLGMTRNNVYAGPAGFWLLRGAYGEVGDSSKETAGEEWDGILPGPAPVAGQGVLDLNVPGNPVRNAIREIPVVIQDRSFNNDGSLFYPRARAFFEGLEKGDLKIPFIGDSEGKPSDVLPIWQPEAFFNVMVVNGVSWPELEVAPALYRLRLLNGCNSRFLWLKFDNPDVKVWQIGAEQGYLEAPVDMNALDLDGRGDGKAQVLMALAERADVIVDFRGLADGVTFELTNIGPDEPFGGGTPGVDFEQADAATSGKVMRFTVNADLLGASPTDPGGDTPATDPGNLVLHAEAPLGDTDSTRNVSLNEAESELVCIIENEARGTIKYAGTPDEEGDCPDGSVHFGPTEALLGTVNGSGSTATGNPLKWTEASDPANQAIGITLNNGANVVVNVTENPVLGETEEWTIYNFTADAHPIHLHLVRFEVLGRARLDGGLSAAGSNDPLPWETGYKDTVISYPDEVTTVKARFDIEGLYVWHCHIVEHEDNEMMRPYFVGDGDFDPAP
jgi:FtsP/CotA-like multicopper oxidase with cupredoxin domain